MNIKILGSGCTKCEKLEKIVKQIVKEQNIEASVEKVGDMKQIIGYGVMRTPALVIDEKVVFSGSVPKKDKVKEFLLMG